ncbi:MAG: ribonuclease J [SAR202 cluster bacterium]|nr:ribonuclease J [SAR202 cluster bacterium]|tara:strand:- start:15750 stop:17387 length:1638 start_codon:yes stop_codon:yes gene_type:complete
MDYSIKIIPLGGLGEIGKNMMAIEISNEIVIIDAGVMFPDEGLPGIDLIIPDTTYLKDNRDKIKGILITHGHEDHTGALPFLLRDITAPIYASSLAKGLIDVKLKEHRGIKDATVIAINPGEPISLGVFEAEFFRVTHSIPDAMGISLTTPIGVIVHTGDFKIDHTPVDGNPTDLTKLAELGDQGVLLLLSDSTYANVEGYTPSESIVGQALNQVIANAEGRVMIATFASLISRIQEILNSALKHSRKVAFVGRSMVNNVNMALKMGYLSAPEGLIVSIKEIDTLPRAKAVIVTTGSQGEPTSALVRISSGFHRDINISNGDTVVISATPIPGNENLVSRTIDNLLRQGATVLYDKIALVHVHGHASQEELKLILRLVKPTFFVPVHGEHRHLRAHAELAQSVGVRDSNTFVLENGNVLELTQTKGHIIDQVPSGAMYIDGRKIYDEYNALLKDRKNLSRDGVLVLIIDRNQIEGTDFISRGFIEEEELSDIRESILEVIKSTLAIASTERHNNSDTKNLIKDKVTSFISQKTRRRPIIIPFISG